MITKKFNEISKNDVAIAGGKGASLGEMTQAGIPVPNGFVVLSDAFEQFTRETDLNVEIDAILDSVKHEEVHTVENASEKIQALILSKKIPNDIEKDVFAAFKNLDTPFVAVRSSATSEDSAAAAWAGQLDSFLNTTKETLLENVKRCWASLFTPRAIFYRFEKELHKEKISVAVVVQKMVNSEESGIAFSVHPVTQDYNQLIIEAGLGLGEAIVSGSVTPDSYVIDKQDWHSIDTNINEQQKALYRKESGGNEWKDLPSEEANKQVLTDEEVVVLSKLIVKIENHYGFPCDIEWAKEDSEFYIVQSRPITTLTKRLDENSENSNLIEMSYFGRRHFTLFCLCFVADAELSHSIYTESKERIFPYCILKRDSSMEDVDIFVNKGIQAFIRDRLKEELTNDEEYFDKLINRCYDKFRKVEEDLKKKTNFKTKEEFKDFLLKCGDIWSEYAIIYWAIDAIEKFGEFKEHLEQLMDFRKHADDFVPNFDAIAKINLKNYFEEEEINYIIPSDVLEDAFSKAKIEKRKQGYFTIDTEVHSIEEKGLLNPYFLNKPKATEIAETLKGNTACKGNVKGRVKVVTDLNHLKDFKKGEILVASMTTPDFMTAIKKCAAIITDEGGIVSHASIISREMNIPCIIGTKVATQVLKDGDKVEVDADNGIVHVLDITSKKEYKKIIERDTTLIMEYPFGKAIKHDLQREYDIDVFDGPAYFHLSNEKNIFFFENPKQRKDLVAVIEKKFLEDPTFIKKIEENYYGNIDKIRKSWKQGKATSVDELKEFVSLSQKPILCVSISYLAGDIDPLPKDAENLVVKIRSDDDFFVSSDEFVRNSLISFGVDPKYTNIVAFDEIDNLPTNEELKQRFVNGAGLIDGDFFKLKDGQTIQDYFPEYQFTFSDEIDPDMDTLQGTTGYEGKVRGIVCHIQNKEDMKKVTKNSVLIASMTTPDFLPAMKKAVAFVTDEGGITCHAAIVSREMKKPCVVGTKVVTQVLNDGDEVEVDADNGIVKVLERAE